MSFARGYKRVIVVDHGLVLYDGTLSGLAERYAPHKTITLHLEHPVDGEKLRRFGDVTIVDELHIEVRTTKDAAPSTTARLLADLPVSDLSVEDPPLEEVIKQVFERNS